MMKNKKAWLRIVEAFIGVMIVASVLAVMITRIPEQKRTENIYEMQRAILREISLNETLRADILQNEKVSTDNFINNIKPAYLNFTTRICEVDEVCGMPVYIEGDVYADEILIATNLTKYSPKKLKLFFWEK